jgi:hypothetical protein
MGHKVPLEGTFVEYEQGQDSFNNHLERNGRKSRIVLLFPQVSVLETLPSEFKATMQLMLCHKTTRRILRSIGSMYHQSSKSEWHFASSSSTNMASDSR